PLRRRRQRERARDLPGAGEAVDGDLLALRPEPRRLLLPQRSRRSHADAGARPPDLHPARAARAGARRAGHDRGPELPAQLAADPRPRQYGAFNEARFDGIGGSLVMMSERNALARNLEENVPMENIQDDYDVWNGAPQLAQWIAGQRHSGGSNYLYMDGHAKF